MASPADIVIYGGSAGGGKALDIMSLIPTPYGWSLMRDIKSGDIVLDDMGMPCSVTATTPIMYNHCCYKVTLANGAEIIADKDHLWCTYTSNDKGAITRRNADYRARRNATRKQSGSGKRPDVAETNRTRVVDYLPHPTGTIVTTEEMAQRLTYGKSKRSNQYIRACNNIVLPDAVLPIHPYVLGAWLGDGTSINGNITKPDMEIYQYISKHCGYGYHKIPSSDNAYCIEGLYSCLKANNLIGNKHIPDAYMWSSIEQRMELIRGLMDTDGTCRHTGVCNFDNTNYNIITDMHALLASIGIKSRITSKVGKYNGKECKTCYRLSFSTIKQVFMLQRKRERLPKKERGVQDWHIVKSVEPVGSVPVKCISVDSPSRMYLVGRDMIPTHNSFGLLMESIRHIRVPDFNATIFRRQTTHIRNPGGLLDESRKLYNQLGGKLSQQSLEWKFANGGKIKLAHLQYDDTVHGYQGSQICLLCYDELTHFTQYQYDYMFSRNRSVCGIKPYIRATCNPDADSWVAEYIAWWINQSTGYAIPERSGVIRYVARVNDKRYWADTAQELIDEHGPDCGPKSITFISASLQDNKILMALDPSYISNLKGMPLVERERLLNGNWLIRPAPGLYFRRSWVDIIPTAPTDIKWVRYWDLAATQKTDGNDPDYTVGVKMGKTKQGRYVVSHCISMQKSPHKVEEEIARVAEADGRYITTVVLPQDPGQAGKSQIQHFIANLAGFNVQKIRESGDKITRFGPFSSQCEAGNVDFVKGAWNDEIFRWLEAFGGETTAHDDHADACSGAFNVLSNQLTSAKVISYY